jgi:prepilin-type N-terminal cleavage/methylation domain-containing protein
MRRVARDARGFTLAELLIVIAILGFMMGALFTLQRQGQFAYLVGAARVEVQQNARIGLDMMLSDIRLGQPQTGTTRVVTAIDIACSTGPVPTNGGATSISFGDKDSPATINTYALNGTDLQKNGATVIGGVQSLRIWCYDGNGALNTTGNLDNIREIRVQIRTQTERGARSGTPGDQHAIVEGRVRFRNV